MAIDLPRGAAGERRHAAARTALPESIGRDIVSRAGHAADASEGTLPDMGIVVPFRARPVTLATFAPLRPGGRR